MNWDMIVGIGLIVIFGLHVGRYAEIFIRITKSYLAIRSIEREHVQGVKLVNMQHVEENHMVNFLWNVATTGATVFICYFIINYFYSIYFLVADSFMLLISLADWPRKYWIYKYGEFAFLTQTSLVSIDGIYKKDRFRFAITTKTSNSDHNATYLNVYSDKSDLSLRFKVVEREEEIVQMINQ